MMIKTLNKMALSISRSIDGRNCCRNRDRILDRIRTCDRIRTWACYRNHLEGKFKKINFQNDILKIKKSVPL